MEKLFNYFSNLTATQKRQIEGLKELYEYWNSQINVISRKDMDYFLERHVLHSLGIAKIITFRPQASILDIGTGGGFPGIPLAILFPMTSFHLVDSVGKKIKVVRAIVEALELRNVEAHWSRAEELKGRHDFVVSRAVAKLDELVPMVGDKISSVSRHKLANGILCLKGGDLKDEIRPFHGAQIYPLSSHFSESFFETKAVVHLPL